jgi:hypothetical protein
MVIGAIGLFPLTGAGPSTPIKALGPSVLTLAPKLNPIAPTVRAGIATTSVAMAPKLAPPAPIFALPSGGGDVPPPSSPSTGFDPFNPSATFPQPAPPSPLSVAVSQPVAVSPGGQGVVRVLQPSASDQGPAPPPVLTVDHPSVSDPAQVTPTASPVLPVGMPLPPTAAAAPSAATSHGLPYALPIAIVAGVALLGGAAYFLTRKR